MRNFTLNVHILSIRTLEKHDLEKLDSSFLCVFQLFKFPKRNVFCLHKLSRCTGVLSKWLYHNVTCVYIFIAPTFRKCISNRTVSSLYFSPVSDAWSSNVHEWQWCWNVSVSTLEVSANSKCRRSLIRNATDSQTPGSVSWRRSKPLQGGAWRSDAAACSDLSETAANIQCEKLENLISIQSFYYRHLKIFVLRWSGAKLRTRHGLRSSHNRRAILEDGTSFSAALSASCTPRPAPPNAGVSSTGTRWCAWCSGRGSASKEL